MSEHPWIVGKSDDEVRREYFPPAETSAPGECRHDRALDLSCGQRECPDCGTSLEVGCEQCAPLRDQLAKHNAALAELRQQLAEAQQQLLNRESRWVEAIDLLNFIASEERACCPEHVGFREYITKLQSDVAAAQAACKAVKEEHCRDCCCAQSWAALGIREYTGKSIPEHISELKAACKAKDAALQAAQAYIECNVADPDTTGEMWIAYLAYREAISSLP